MQLPVHDPNHPPLRPARDVRAMALAIQSNLALLRDADARLSGIDPEQHDIHVPDAHGVVAYTDTLIDPATLEQSTLLCSERTSLNPPLVRGEARTDRYTKTNSALATWTADQVHLGLHEVWGQFCLMCWLFSVRTSPADADLAHLDDNDEMHCETALEAKHAEVHALFWRIVFEQRRRSDPEYVSSPRFAEDQAVAEPIPAIALGTPVEKASDADLLLAASEHAGMLATLRWVMDARRVWNAPGIAVPDERPF